jgi:hypothetical protein
LRQPATPWAQGKGDGAGHVVQCQAWSRRPGKRAMAMVERAWLSSWEDKPDSGLATAPIDLSTCALAAIQPLPHLEPQVVTKQDRTGERSRTLGLISEEGIIRNGRHVARSRKRA